RAVPRAHQGTRRGLGFLGHEGRVPAGVRGTCARGRKGGGGDRRRPVRLRRCGPRRRSGVRRPARGEGGAATDLPRRRGALPSQPPRQGGAAIVVSQFTLLAGTEKGNRPSFSAAAAPAEAGPIY